MPLNLSCSESAVSENIAREMKSGRTQKQAIAIAMSTLSKACRLTPELQKKAREQRWTTRKIMAMGKKKNPYPLIIAGLNPSKDPQSFAGYRKGLAKFRQSHGAKAELCPIVADIPGVKKGTTWVLQGDEKSVVYSTEIVRNSKKGKDRYEHNVGEGVKIPVVKLRYYLADKPGVEMIVTVNAETGKIISSYKKGWMDESKAS